MSGKECKTCGRPDRGHWIGCAEAVKELQADGWTVGPAVAEADHCAHGECTDLRRSADKRVKFCEFHSDPKNRK
jgi:hypothetical protein